MKKLITLIMIVSCMCLTSCTTPTEYDYTKTDEAAELDYVKYNGLEYDYVRVFSLIDNSTSIIVDSVSIANQYYDTAQKYMSNYTLLDILVYEDTIIINMTYIYNSGGTSNSLVKATRNYTFDRNAFGYELVKY